MGSQLMIYELASKVNQELVAKKAAKFGPLEVTERKNRRGMFSLATFLRAIRPRHEPSDQPLRRNPQDTGAAASLPSLVGQPNGSAVPSAEG